MVTSQNSSIISLEKSTRIFDNRYPLFFSFFVVPISGLFLRKVILILGGLDMNSNDSINECECKLFIKKRLPKDLSNHVNESSSTIFFNHIQGGRLDDQSRSDECVKITQHGYDKHRLFYRCCVINTHRLLVFQFIVLSRLI